MLLVLTALPEFVIGLGLLLLLATSVFHALPAVALIPPGDNAFEHPSELALPVLTLVLTVIPYLARLQRAAMIDVLDSEYVQMARLKGVRERSVIRRHALRNSIVPIIQGSALTLIYLTGGIVTIEYLFAFPGLGSALAAGVQSRDLPVVQAIVLLFAASLRDLQPARRRAHDLRLAEAPDEVPAMSEQATVAPPPRRRFSSPTTARALGFGRTRVGIVVTAAIVLIALIGPFVAPHDPVRARRHPAPAALGRLPAGHRLPRPRRPLAPALGRAQRRLDGVRGGNARRRARGWRSACSRASAVAPRRLA